MLMSHPGTLLRGHLLRALVLALAFSFVVQLVAPASTQAQGTTTVTDVVGRTVTV
jgi:hypothetical protein